MKKFIFLMLLTGISFGFDYKEDLFEKRNAIVVEVSDGDTIKVKLNGKIEKVRLSFVDTMESKKNKKAKKDFNSTYENVRFNEIIEYGKKAKNFLKRELPNGTRVLLYIPLEKPRDSFKRILAIVVKEKDKKVINEILLLNGLARTYYLKDAPEDLREYYLKLERKAQEENLGIWKIIIKK
ncbi:MAG: thermonuclease family protein [Brevinematales bacterium]|nr:thermonuclease family protein [Brevinematales bacterium]